MIKYIGKCFKYSEDISTTHIYPGYICVIRKDTNENFRVERLNEEELCKKIAKEIADGKILGWFQGRMEWGPRALGNRSIVVDPRRKDMKDILNARIKKRESFRPFAPSILEEKTARETLEVFEEVVQEK